MTALRALAAEKMRFHRGQFIGAELDVITLHTPAAAAAAGHTSALTDNFLPVELTAAALPSNQLVRVHVSGLAADATLLASPEFANASGLTQDSRGTLAESVMENAL
jgi:hypothetical protein